MEKKLLPSIFVLVSINIMDSLMNAVVGPTLIFYGTVTALESNVVFDRMATSTVSLTFRFSGCLLFKVRSLGGTKEDYGRMLSLSSLSSMFMMPVFGKWVDSNGGRYHPPYTACFLLGMMSSLCYFGAILLPKGNIAIFTMLFSFLLSGGADAGRTLAYSWVASVIPKDKQRTILTFLSMSRMFGGIVGPLLNILVSGIDTEFTIFGKTIPLNPYNSIGLLIFAGEVTLVSAMTLFLTEPPEPKENKRESVASIATANEAKGILYALGHFDIFFPVFTMFTLACAFQMIFTGLSPVASHIGYNPVQISEIYAANSAVIAFSMVASVTISMRKGVSDAAMIFTGINGLMIGSASMYFFWTIGLTYWEFILPVFVLSAGYPFIGPANRSRFTQAIHARKELEGCQGVMLSIINQAFAFASFVAPTAIASFVIRSPESMATTGSTDDHYLTIGALCIPGLCFLALIGICYSSCFLEPLDKPDDSVVSESSALMGAKTTTRRASMLEINDRFSVYSEAQRRLSVEVMGVPNPFETKYEKELSQQLLNDKKEWEELERLDRIEDEK